MSAAFDLSAYLLRIGYAGPTKPDHATLAGLLAAHMNAVPFENIDVLLGRPIRLDAGSLQEKIVRNGRGGYCFEQGALFLAALRTIGFDATPRTARVTIILKPNEASRGHLFLLVRLPEGEFVADPGLGGFGCRTPIPLDGRAVRDGDESFRIAFDGRCRMLKVESGERKIDAWNSGVDKDNWVDFEVANYWTSTHRDSPFVQRLMMRAMIPGGRLTVMNREATIRRDGRQDTFLIADRAQLRTLVRERLGFDCGELEQLKIPSVPDWT